MKYLASTNELVLRLQADNLNIVKWWVDTSFAVHLDMKSHTGGTMSLGIGDIYSSSSKQKLNNKSSTESELITANDILPQELWTKDVLKHQGYDTTMENVQWKAHQAHKYKIFFITDNVKNGNVVIQYCPTKEMVTDYQTKSLQGKNSKI